MQIISPLLPLVQHLQTNCNIVVNLIRCSMGRWCRCSSITLSNRQWWWLNKWCCSSSSNSSRIKTSVASGLNVRMESLADTFILCLYLLMHLSTLIWCLLSLCHNYNWFHLRLCNCNSSSPCNRPYLRLFQVINLYLELMLLAQSCSNSRHYLPSRYMECLLDCNSIIHLYLLECILLSIYHLQYILLCAHLANRGSIRVIHTELNSAETIQTVHMVIIVVTFIPPFLSPFHLLKNSSCYNNNNNKIRYN